MSSSKLNLMESRILQPTNCIRYYADGKNVRAVYNLGMHIVGQSILYVRDEVGLGLGESRPLLITLTLVT